MDETTRTASAVSIHLGLVGLGVMGRALALQFAERGYPLAAYDRAQEAREALAAAARGGIETRPGLDALVRGLPAPRAVLLMVPAGAPVDEALDELAPLLASEDIVLDGGNSHFEDTRRRGARLSARGIHYLGVGISGGEAGAREGASIMVGGPEPAYRQVEPMLTAIAARVDGEPCRAWFGPDGAGHFVKMVHNGIEYAAMQLIAEVYWLLRHLAGLSYSEIAAVFGSWAQGRLGGYLIDITADVLDKIDNATGKPALDVILDRAEQKGTGRWAIATALELGSPAPIMAAAVHARALSALKAERVAASRSARRPRHRLAADREAFVEALERTLYAALVMAYAEGFALLAAAARSYRWPLALAEVARIWRGGCILRARLLEDIRAAYGRQPDLAHLSLDRGFADAIDRALPDWRRAVRAAVARALPIPALAAALGALDGYRSGRLWADLIQAQRDYFGRHGFERTDRPGRFHHDWRKS